jgi:hypothetical protein
MVNMVANGELMHWKKVVYIVDSDLIVC